MTVSSGTMSPSFRNDTYFYTVNVLTSVTAVTLTITPISNNAVCRISGTALVSGIASAPITLSVGSRVVIINCIAQDGSTLTLNYNCTIVRPPCKI